MMREYRADMVRRGLMPSTIAARVYEARRWQQWRADDVFARDELDLAEFLDRRPTGHSLGPRARYTAISHLHDFPAARRAE
jgi:hypothetical protein